MRARSTGHCNEEAIDACDLGRSKPLRGIRVRTASLVAPLPRVLERIHQAVANVRSAPTVLEGRRGRQPGPFEGDDALSEPDDELSLHAPMANVPHTEENSLTRNDQILQKVSAGPHPDTCLRGDRVEGDQYPANSPPGLLPVSARAGGGSCALSTRIHRRNASSTSTSSASCA